MPSERVEKATFEHCEMLARVMRDSDQNEVFASDGMTGKEALIMSLKNSQGNAFAGFVDDEIVSMWGVVPCPNGEGIIWMLGSDSVVSNRRRLMRYAAEFVNHESSCYTALWNMVDDRNAASLNWLRHLGFSIGEPVPHGYLGLPFRLVRKEIRGQ